MQDFFPTDYQVPNKGTNRYPKIEKLESGGEMTVRILSKPLIAWKYFNKDTDKPVVSKEKPTDLSNAKPDKFNPGPQLDEIWDFIIYNYETERIEILEIKKKTIKEGMMTYYLEPSYGNFDGYDIKFKKEGDGKDTKYKVLALSKEPVSKEIMDLFKEEQVNLDAILTGGKPFKKDNKDENSKEIDKTEKQFERPRPTKEEEVDISDVPF